MRTDEVLFSFSLFSLVLCFQLCSTGDTLKAGQKITLNSFENLVSSNRTFELGFFPLSGSSSVVKRYLGIWYHGLEPQTVVWVANRDKPVLDSSGVFRIAEDGNLVIEGASSESYWSSKIEAYSSTNRTVKLLESGNLVLMDDNLGRSNYTWQSFQHPTDTFLPGMKMDASVALTSWRNSTDPAPGNFTFTMAPEDERGSFAVQKLSQIYWDLDELDRDVNSQVVSNLLGNTTTRGTRSHNFSNKTVYTSKPYNYKKSRLLMNSSGELQFLKWDEDEGQWEKRWWGPADECDIHDSCGSFGICNRNNHIGCKCLPGFAPIPEGELQGHGCVRKSTSCINTDVTFLNLTNIKVGNPDHEIFTETEAECQSFCISKCPLCQAYSYNRSTYSDRSPFTCNIWTQNLSSLVEEYDRGRDLSILVKRSDIAPTAKTCEPCGTYEIPYPLSTGPNCGDPMYNKFNCTKSTGQVNFMTPKGISYQVTRIEEDTRTFFIHTNASYSCSSRRDQSNTPNFPFNVAECIPDVGVLFRWQPAPEPPCNRPMDCMNWPYSTCRETSEGGTRCHCDLKYRWNNSIMSCTQEPPSNRSYKRLELILTIILISTITLACIIVLAIVRRKKNAPKPDRASTQIQESLYESERQVKGLIGLGSLEEKDIEGIEVPCYTYASILAATDNFSDSNKLGRGGYGPVYKGTFPGGQDIAVKRLSSVSTQGLEEFKNEVILIAKLQHRNLVRLRGYCIEGDEKILLYEYMPNKSLDSFIFDPTRTSLLDWPIRFEIIVGIARALSHTDTLSSSCYSFLVMESRVLSRAGTLFSLPHLRKLPREVGAGPSLVAVKAVGSVADGGNLIWGRQLRPELCSPALKKEAVLLRPCLAAASSPAEGSDSAGEAKVAPAGFFEKYPALVTGFFFFTWYFLNVIFNILNKKIYNYFPYPYFVSVIHLFVGVAYCLVSWAVGLPKRAPIDSNLLKLLIPVAVCHALGHVTSNVSFAAVAVSFTHTIKALEPFFNAAASQFILGQSIPITLWLSLAPVVIGVSMASLTELSFNWVGFISAMISNISFTYRSIYSKKAMTDMDSTNIYAYISIIALIVCIPPAVILEGPTLLKHGFNDAIAKVGLVKFVSDLFWVGMFYHLYNQVATNTLERVAPLTHAVGNVLKRVFVIGFSIIVFGNKISTQTGIGTAIAIAGVALYSFIKARMEEEKRQAKAA